jgi:hypothetical protein
MAEQTNEVFRIRPDPGSKTSFRLPQEELLVVDNHTQAIIDRYALDHCHVGVTSGWLRGEKVVR